MFEHARPPCIIPILARFIHWEWYTEVLVLHLLKIEATVNIRSWSCGMFPRCAINVTGVLLLEITKPPICILHAHHRTLESLQDVYWGFKLDVVAWYSWSLKPQWTADTRTFYMATVVVHRALKHHNFCCCAWFLLLFYGGTKSWISHYDSEPFN